MSAPKPDEKSKLALVTEEKPILLAVDDEAQILEALRRLLQKRFNFISATSVPAAQKILSLHPNVAIVLSDYQMPEQDGLKFLSALKTTHPLAARALISGQIDLAPISLALNDQDIHKFFLKPWENEYLQLKMEEAYFLHLTLKEKAHFQHLSVTDPVTKLTNHRFFQDQLRQFLHSNTKVSLLMLDVDNFKAFNDRFGHPEGDQLLFNIAQHIQYVVGSKGLVSRYGGEEFTVLLPHHSGEAALICAEEIRHYIERTAFPGLSASPAFVTISIGVATSSEHGLIANELIEAADRALYQAKRQGRNQVVQAPLGINRLRR